MTRALQPNTKLTLSLAGRTTEFVINEVLGVGGSCIAYEVSYKEDEEVLHRGVLKEYCPSYLSGEDFQRDGTSLRIPESQWAEFETGLRNFRGVYKSINRYLLENTSATNYHPVQLGLYEGNNTAYTLVSRDFGKSYDKVPNHDLKSLLKLSLSVTKAVGNYHEAGFLHLDIKPKNILVLNEVTDIVKLFDFDSITAMDRLRTEEGITIPAPEEYYVPELATRNAREIGIHTDIFEIGAMLFLRLFERAPEVLEMSHDAEYELEKAPLLKGASPELMFEMENLFKHTIQVAKRRRYRSTEELKIQLEKLIELADASHLYLLNMPKWQASPQRIGRHEELKEVARRLEEDGYVFVKGVGGIGKSEMAKMFAKQYGDRFHTVQFCKYNGSLKMLTASLEMNGIKDENERNFDELVKEKNRVLHTSGPRTLIVVDNFNVTHDDFLREFLPTDNHQFKVIFTTRCQMEADYYKDKTYELTELSEEDCEKLFFKHYITEPTEDKKRYVRNIISAVGANTLVLVLLAKAVQKTGISLEEMLKKLKSQELDKLEIEIFHEYDFSSEERKTYNQLYTHLKTVFNVSELEKEELEILKNLTLISQRGIEIEEFTSCCKLAVSYPQGVIRDLIARGWIENMQANLISMHSIISDMIANDTKIPKHKSYYQLASHLEDFCTPDYESHISVVESKLFTAIQLDKRYQKERVSKRLLMKIKLGRMYTNVYQPELARKYFDEAEKIAKKYWKRQYIPFIHFFQGIVEEKFGSSTTAIEYFFKVIREERWVRDWHNRFRLVLESMEEIASIQLENKNYELAFYAYKSSLFYAKSHLLFTYIDGILNPLISICGQMGWSEREEKYKKMKKKYQKYAGETDYCVEQERLLEEQLCSGNVGDAIRIFDEMLEQKRIELGENSPVYQDFAQNGWVAYAVKNQKEFAVRGAVASLEFCEKTYGENSMLLAEQLALVANLISELFEIEYAVECANRAIKICEHNRKEESYIYVQAKLALAKIFNVRGQIDETKALIESIDFQRCVTKEQLEEAIKSVGLPLVDLEMYDIAEDLAKKLIRRKNVPVYDLFWGMVILGEVRLAMGAIEEAKAYTKEAKNHIEKVQDYPKKREILIAYYRLAGKIAYQEGDCHLAIKQLDMLLAMYTEEEQQELMLSGVFFDRATYHVQIEEYELANHDYEMCEMFLEKEASARENYVMLYHNMALNDISMCEFEKSKMHLDKIIEIESSIAANPENYFDALICNNMGWTLMNLDRAEEAEGFLQKALDTLDKFENMDEETYQIVLENMKLCRSLL